VWIPDTNQHQYPPDPDPNQGQSGVSDYCKCTCPCNQKEVKTESLIAPNNLEKVFGTFTYKFKKKNKKYYCHTDIRIWAMWRSKPTTCWTYCWRHIHTRLEITTSCDNHLYKVTHNYDSKYTKLVYDENGIWDKTVATERIADAGRIRTICGKYWIATVACEFH
jgi:hypothetical protein